MSLQSLEILLLKMQHQERSLQLQLSQEESNLAKLAKFKFSPSGWFMWDQAKRKVQGYSNEIFRIKVRISELQKDMEKYEDFS